METDGKFVMNSISFCVTLLTRQLLPVLHLAYLCHENSPSGKAKAILTRMDKHLASVVQRNWLLMPQRVSSAYDSHRRFKPFESDN